MTYNQFTLSQAAAFDRQNGAKEKLTGWGIICKLRQSTGVSKKARRARKEKGEGN